MNVRTRVAPSPTGDPHVGTAFVALTNLCFARKNGGRFVLRIEDTDRARSTSESEAAILHSLRWLGLSWDEGPDAGGACGPYRQSERFAIYREHVARLLAEGHAFKCFCTPERLEEMRIAQRAAHQPPRYDGHCLALTPQEVAAKEAAGVPSVVRLKVPSEGSCSFHDLLRGPIEIEWKSVDMQVLMKSDGFPTYHLANVVDDHLMGVTHVIRGEEWISSTPKHVLLYEDFGWAGTMPSFCHLPLLRNPDKSKLSKRKNPTSIWYYRDLGVPPEALLHFLGTLIDARNDAPELLGRGDSTADRTRLLLEHFSEHFALEHLSVGGPVFDTAKLRWLSGQWIRRRTPAQFQELLDEWGYRWPHGIAPEKREHVARVAMERIEVLSDFGPLVEFLAEPPEVTKRDLTLPKLSEPETRGALESAIAALLPLEGDSWNQAAIGDALKKSVAALGLKLKDVVRAFYVAVTGSPTSLPLFDGMEILGKTESLRRFELAREKLH